MPGSIKSFTVELRDLYPGDSFTAVTVYYDCGELCAQPLKDEFGREWSLKQLSIYDIQAINKNLVLELSADEASEEFERAEELMNLHFERI